MDNQKVTLPQLTGRILLVDDEKAVLMLSQRLLAEIGCQVTACENPTQALAIFRQSPTAFDAVLTDHLMPGMTGLELAVEIMATRPDLPILLLTGAGAEVTALPAASPGIREFLAKPISLAGLAAVLGRYLPTH